jgi:hypothetical protein
VQEHGTNTVSIISVLEEIQITLPPGAPAIPQNSALPMQWMTISIWQRESGDENTSFEIRSVLYSPTEQALIEGNIVTFTFQEGMLRFRVIEQIFGFPISASYGQRQLVLQLRRVGEQSFAEAARFPVVVTQSGAAVASP